MANVRVTFEVLKGVTPDHIIEVKVKSGYKYVGTHMIFDIKMDGKFNCRTRIVAGGHNTAPSSYITYSSAVTRESVILSFIIYVLNNLYICSCDTGNAYLNDPCQEKM